MRTATSLFAILAACTLLAVHPTAARAADASVLALGPRVGFSASPDQFVFGGQLKVGEIAPQVTFDPILDLGFGDHETTVAMNFDFHYHLRLRDSDWRPYFGPGIGIAFYTHDNPPPFRDDSSTEVGGNLVGGAEVRTRGGSDFFGELRLGLGDIPSLKMMVGWNFLM